MKYLICLPLILSASTAAWAQDTIVTMESERDPNAATDIVVTATGTQLPIDQTGQSISVIGQDEIDAVQGPDLTRVLERLPGVTLSRNGGLGSTTSLFVRGANSQQLAVLIDGVRVADMAAPSGGFDFGNLEAGGIGKIELLRGSNSVAWGSDAIGGVLAVTTREIDGVEASAEYGAHDTWVLDGGAGVSTDRYAFSVNGGYTRSDGISAAAAGTEPDPYRQWRVSGKARLGLTDTLSLVANARHSDSRVAFDSYLFVDDGEYQTAEVDSGRVGLNYNGDALRLSAGVGLSNTHREYFDPAFSADPNYVTSGRSVHADLKGSADVTPALRLDFGADGDWSRFSSSYDPRQTARLAGGHALLTYHSERFSLSGGARYDDHDRFGGHWTFGVNGAVGLTGDWRLRASYGEGFKAPALYQLYGYGGNTALRPESSESFEVGIEKGDRNAPLHFAATAFRRDSNDLIDYLWPTGYLNVARARAQGFEVELGARISDTLRAQAAYTYLEPTNRDTGLDLARRARPAVTTSLDWTSPLAGLELGADLRMVGDSFDNAGNTVRLDGYRLLTVRASLPLGDNVELFGRVENLTDEAYQIAAGYGTYGRSAYAGARLRW